MKKFNIQHTTYYSNFVWCRKYKISPILFHLNLKKFNVTRLYNNKINYKSHAMTVNKILNFLCPLPSSILNIRSNRNVIAWLTTVMELFRSTKNTTYITLGKYLNCWCYFLLLFVIFSLKPNASTLVER